MTKQKTIVLEGRNVDGGATDKPKKGKQRRTAGQLEEVKRWGEYIAGIVGGHHSDKFDQMGGGSARRFPYWTSKSTSIG